jgi:hypothetical protein
MDVPITNNTANKGVKYGSGGDEPLRLGGRGNTSWHGERENINGHSISHCQTQREISF